MKTTAALVADSLRQEDVFARYGGEEFGIIFRDTEGERAFLIAERIRRKIEAHAYMWEGDEMAVTVSIGLSTLNKDVHRTAKALVQAADAKLYEAKNKGRNRTESDVM